jgi:hypothetical protein
LRRCRADNGTPRKAEPSRSELAVILKGPDVTLVRQRELTGAGPTGWSVSRSRSRCSNPEALKKDLNAAEAHYKDALLSRTPLGYNKN